MSTFGKQHPHLNKKVIESYHGNLDVAVIAHATGIREETVRKLSPKSLQQAMDYAELISKSQEPPAAAPETDGAVCIDSVLDVLAVMESYVKATPAQREVVQVILTGVK